MYEYVPPISVGFAGLCYLIAGVVCALRGVYFHAAARTWRVNPRHILEAISIGCTDMYQARSSLKNRKEAELAACKRRIITGILLAVIGLGGLLTDFLRMW